ncbi:hypothetical protein GGR58DRAFT_510328 [Xylaria digitata]|nr:hypothetical protein GGR58DRAFT_510328 [Xylaria digitata]
MLRCGSIRTLSWKRYLASVSELLSETIAHSLAQIPPTKKTNQHPPHAHICHPQVAAHHYHYQQRHHIYITAETSRACAVGDPGDLNSSCSPELPGQLAVKTSSSKKRKITPRQSASRNEEIEPIHSPDIPVQSCEQDSDLNFSFTTSAFDVLPASPAYLRTESLPPASSLPPRLQTNHLGSLAFAEDGSSVASSPSGAYADLTIHSDRGADTPAPDFANYPRGSSPFAKTTHHRAIMGGAADFPERASSPLKRRASSMDLENVAQDTSEDIDMTTVPPSDKTALNTSVPLPQDSSNVNGVSESIASMQQDTQPAAAGVGLTTTNDAATALQPPVSIEDHFNRTPCVAGQECYIVSRQWLTYVPLDSTKKQVTSDLSAIPPVDNSDIIEEVIDDPCVGKGVTDVMKKKFVRLKNGYGEEHFVPFPPKAWELLMQWPGLKEGQIPIRRTATDNSTNRDGTNVQIEYHPLVLTIPVDALARSSNMKFQDFLKQAKAMVKIDLTQRVRGWHIPNATETYPSDAIMPNPPAPPAQSETVMNSEAMWNHLLVDVQSFNELERGGERLMIDFGDLTNNPNNKSNKKLESNQTLRSLGIAKDQPIVLDPHEEGTQWTSNYIPTETTTLTSRTSSTTLTVQNHAPPGRRASPTPTGPITRGRATKSGRTLGCVGLTNLGNTSVEELTKYFLIGEWERELNKANVLAHNEIHKDPPPGAVAPRQFKQTIGRHAPQFSGYGQQDSQEFLGFLLDGLQEDLSRVKKKPYIEKPDSTDEMIGDPEAIRKMADEVWDITRKRDDSIIADLFTGLYKSTLVCPVCDKLPIANKWSHTVKVELDKHDSIKGLKQFISARTSVPIERLHGCEEWTKNEEISSRDNAWVFELEAKPTNFPGTTPKQQKYRSLLDDTPSVSWDDEDAAYLLVPVVHRRPKSTKSYQSHQKWEGACVPHFIMVTPQEARSEDIIRRKILEKVATFTKHPLFARMDESDGSETTEPELIGPNGSDTASSVGGKVVAQSVGSDDDIVDVRMKDASDKNSNVRSPSLSHIKHGRPAWINVKTFLPPQFQNLFEIGIFSEVANVIPSGNNTVSDEKDFPRLSSRVPAEPPSSEDQFDNATNGTASNDDSSSDEAPRRSTESQLTRMNEESDDDENGLPVKVPPRPLLKSHGPNNCMVRWTYDEQPLINYTKGNKQPPNGRKKMKGRQYGSKGTRKRMRQQRQQQDKQNAIHFEDPADLSDPIPDGGPLIRLKEGLVVDWSETAYEEIFGAEGSLETWESCETLSDPDLERSQEARAKRRKRGLTLDECLDEFERDEVLSEQDMWYCPRCKEHRRASKKLDLWKTPDILIIHLKRFSSSGFRRDKLETVVDFPTENLDITSRVLQTEEGKQEIYDLIGVDCHYGGLGGGHYTAYAKNFNDGQWYSYNDSSVSKTTTDRIVDSSAYMLFYRRRSNVPLGGPILHRILERFGDDDDDEMSGLGEGQRLGEGFSQNGSSSALQGAGVSHLAESRGSNATSVLHRPNMSTFTVDDRGDDDIPLLASSRFQSGQVIDEDEGIELEDSGPSAQPFTGINTWSFKNLENTTEDSPFGSGAASDEAQHDSSGDERALSLQDDIESSFPGMSEYKLPQPKEDPPSYINHSPPAYLNQPLTSATNQITHEVHEVIPSGEQEPQSDEATEIHLDDNDKIKVP